MSLQAEAVAGRILNLAIFVFCFFLPFVHQAPVLEHQEEVVPHSKQTFVYVCESGCGCGFGCMCPSIPAEVGRQLVRVSSLLPCKFLTQNSGGLAWL